MNSPVDAGRRALLRGRVRSTPPLRPPWSRPESEFVAACTRCGDCLAACPEGILVTGDGGFPAVDFRRGECTFCRACVDACPAPAFLSPATLPWSLKARILEACLARRGSVCQSCGDVCEARAIRFAPVLGRVPMPDIQDDACTGCGACVAVCPVSAIQIKQDPSS